jgi:hypothetical protein
MDKLLLVSCVAIAGAGAASWQHHQAHDLRRQSAGLRAQVVRNEQMTWQLQSQNDAARRSVEASEAVVFDLQTQVAAAANLLNASATDKTAASATRWDDDAPFVRLSKAHLTSLSVGVIANDGSSGSHLPEPAGTLLGLSSEELSAVNGAIGDLCGRYLALELARAPQAPKYERSREGVERVFAIPRLETEGAELKRAFTEALVGAIGQARTDLLLHYGRDVFWRQLAGFGENAKTVALTPRLDGQGREQVKVYVNFEGPQNGAYFFTLSSADEPNAPLARALWERAQAAAK